MKKNTKTKEQLLAENEDLRRRLEEAEETLRAIHEGEVDALVLSKPQGDVVFTLKGAEHPYRVFVEAMNEGAATLDPEGTILYCNNRFAEMVKLSTDKLIGSSIHRFIPTKDRFGFELAFQGGLQGNSTADISLKREDQGLIPVHLSFNPLHDQHMPVVCLVAMDLTEPKRLEEALRQLNADLENRIQGRTAELRKVNEALQAEIVERKRAEEAIRQSEERLRFALETIHAGAWDLDLVDHSAFRSLEHDRIFGYTQLLPEWTYEMFLEHVLPEDRAMVDGKFQEATENQSDWSFESRIRRTDGQVRWIWAAGRHTNVAAGAPLRMAGIVQDITERKQVEEALRESERLYRAIGESIDYGVWVCAPDGRNIYASESFLKMVGLTQEECSNFGWGDVLHPDDAAQTIEAWRECVRTEGTWDIEHRFRGVDGQWHAILARGVPVRNDQKEIICWAGINLDISELKRAEAERERLSIEAENERRRLEAVLEALPVGLAITDPQGGNIRSNRAFEQIWSGPLPRTESIDDYSTYKAWWADTGKPVDPEEWASAQAIRKREPVFHQVMKIQRFDGSLAFVINSAAPVFDDHNKIAGCAVAIQDITDLRKAEEALRESESRFRLLSETAGQLLATNNPSAKVNELCRMVMEHLGCQVFFNFLADEESGRLHLNACAGIPEAEVRKIEWLDYGAAVCGCVARDGVRIVAENIGLTPDPRTDLVRSYDVRAYACHPLMARDWLIGTLSFGSKTRAEFTPEDLALMKTVSDQVSTAMERIRLIEELQRSREELEMRVKERTAELELLNQALKAENEMRLESEIELRESENRLRQLSTELLYAQEKERRLVAQDLHDSIGSSLAAIKFKVEAALLQTGNNTHQQEPAFEGVIPAIQTAIQETRRIQKALRPPVLDELGILATIRWFCREFESTYTAVRIRQEIDIEEEEVPDPLKIVIFRVLQEALNNIAKYSGADLVRLTLRKAPGRTELVIEDQGQGFDLKEVLGSESTQRGLGLTSMKERTELSGGSFSIDSVRGKGTVIRAVWPV